MTRRQFLRKYNGLEQCLPSQVVFSCTCGSLEVLLLLFRPYQIMGLKGKLFLVASLLFSLDALYRVALQLRGISHSKLSVLKKIPLNVLFLSSICWQIYLLTNAFRSLSKRLNLFFKMLMPSCFPLAIGIFVASYIYPMYSKQDGKGKLLIAIFSPLIGVVLKVISRICVQRLWRITHPGRSFVLLAPLYFGTAVMFRVLQAELDSLKSIAILGIVHGATVFCTCINIFTYKIFHF